MVEKSPISPLEEVFRCNVLPWSRQTEESVPHRAIFKYGGIQVNHRDALWKGEGPSLWRWEMKSGWSCQRHAAHSVEQRNNVGCQFQKHFYGRDATSHLGCSQDFHFVWWWLWRVGRERGSQLKMIIMCKVPSWMGGRFWQRVKWRGDLQDQGGHVGMSRKKKRGSDGRDVHASSPYLAGQRHCKQILENSLLVWSDSELLILSDRGRTGSSKRLLVDKWGLEEGRETPFHFPTHNKNICTRVISLWYTCI